MLQVKDIHKEYKLGELTQVALNTVSVDFRDSEFVSILGPSGSGKTTLLNIIGGLDRYDNGDLLINGVSTKNYKDRDWDTYRNHTIGFVFQSYNLIGHQTILANVELALTIGGVSKEERTKRAKAALEQVGLKDHIHKKPNQLSGGQMQRVAIARALINNPDILLADEPTGALDTETSVQIMDLLKNVSEEKLVVMVTHNPELAEEYSSRIIKLKDGNIVGDSNPFTATDVVAAATARNGVKKAKMKLLTAFALSMSNLSTKKRRTLLTAFAGSIGIVGIALILSLSNGVNSYIEDLQRDTMASYPLTIEAETMDMTAMMGGPMGGMSSGGRVEEEVVTDGIGSDFSSLEDANTVEISNNLTAFKDYLEDETSEIAPYLGEDGVHYSYDTNFSVYAYDSDGILVSTDADPSELTDGSSSFALPGGGGDPMAMMAGMAGGTGSSATNFSEITPAADGSAINETILQNYDLLAGEWPTDHNQVVLVADQNHTLSAETLYQLGLMTADDYEDYADAIESGEEVEAPTYNYDDLLAHEFTLLTGSDKYLAEEDGLYTLVSDDLLPYSEEVLDRALTLDVVAVVAPIEDATDTSLTTSVGYTNGLTDYIIETSNQSAVLLAQQDTPDVNVLTGTTFETLSDEDKIADITAYLQASTVSEKADYYTLIQYSSQQNATEESETTDSATEAPANMSMTAQEPTDDMMAGMLDQWLVETPDNDILLQFYDELLSGSYDQNLKDFGMVNYDTPSAINIYTDSFEAKDGVALSIEHYNETASEENQIVYVDYVETLTSAMTTMIDTISYVLIAFVAVSLVVSCIMVGIITHISVIERTKEIGVLRALGASKQNISQVFNAETFIIGLCSGVLGIAATVLINIPVNSIIASLLADSSVNVSLPMEASVILLAISVLVTIVGGILPAKKAALKDPVLALRSE